MKKFKFFLGLLFLTIIATGIHSNSLEKSRVPDAGLAALMTLSIGLVISLAGLGLDLLFIFKKAGGGTSGGHALGKALFQLVLGASIIIGMYLIYVFVFVSQP